MSEKDKDRPTNEQRKHYRITYPDRLNPKLEWQNSVYKVIDVSEGGVAVAIKNGDPISKAVGQITARIQFLCGDSVTVSGNILRSRQDTVILMFKQGVPLPTVMKEQRYLLQKFGNLGKTK
jgi:hypothetical protein